MTTPFTKPVSRELELADIFAHKGQVIVTLNSWGIELRKKNTSRKIHYTWERLASIKSVLPPNAPAKFVDNPIGWLVQE